MKIIAFGASTSTTSINKAFAAYVASLFNGHDVEVIDLNDYEMPLFSVDLESELGHQPSAIAFVEKLSSADLLIVSMAEHNGAYTAAFKNILDWSSRYKSKVFEDKKMLLLSTSPGGRGGLGALEAAKMRFPIHGASIIATFSLPKFQENFNAASGILDTQLSTQLSEAVALAKVVLA
jgi:chromate reductase, NAD(P)H dehydrogenase (quinone)